MSPSPSDSQPVQVQGLEAEREHVFRQPVVLRCFCNTQALAPGPEGRGDGVPKPTGGGCGGVVTPLHDHGGPTFFPEVPHSPKRLTDSPTLVNLEKRRRATCI